MSDRNFMDMDTVAIDLTLSVKEENRELRQRIQKLEESITELRTRYNTLRRNFLDLEDDVDALRNK